jgi:hypothetical protein
VTGDDHGTPFTSSGREGGCFVSSPGTESPEYTELAWWTSHPAEREEARRLSEADAGPGGSGAAAGGATASRLTLTVVHLVEVAASARRVRK